MELLRRLHEQQRLTILMVNHDLTAVRKAVQEVIWIHRQGLHGPVAVLLSPRKKSRKLWSWKFIDMACFAKSSIHFVLRNSFMLYWSASVVLWWGSYLVFGAAHLHGGRPAQISSAACFRFRFAAFGLVRHMHLGHFAGDERLLALIGGLGFTLAAILFLALMSAAGAVPSKARGTLYCVAGAGAFCSSLTIKRESFARPFAAPDYYCPGLGTHFHLDCLRFVAAGMLNL